MEDIKVCGSQQRTGLTALEMNDEWLVSNPML